MPQIVTGLEPDTSQGWNFEGDQIFAKSPQGTPTRAIAQGYRLVSVVGFDLLGDCSIGNIHQQLSQKGYWINYISLWRNPPSFLGTGNDDYIAIVVARA